MFKKKKSGGIPLARRSPGRSLDRRSPGVPRGAWGAAVALGRRPRSPVPPLGAVAPLATSRRALAAKARSRRLAMNRWRFSEPLRLGLDRDAGGPVDTMLRSIVRLAAGDPCGVDAFWVAKIKKSRTKGVRLLLHSLYFRDRRAFFDDIFLTLLPFPSKAGLNPWSQTTMSERFKRKFLARFYVTRKSTAFAKHHRVCLAGW